MGKAKLSAADVAEIRRQYDYVCPVCGGKRRRKLIMQQFHITNHALWQLVNGRTHKSQSETSFPQGQK